MLSQLVLRHWAVVLAAAILPACAPQSGTGDSPGVASETATGGKSAAGRGGSGSGGNPGSTGTNPGAGGSNPGTAGGNAGAGGAGGPNPGAGGNAGNAGNAGAAGAGDAGAGGSSADAAGEPPAGPPQDISAWPKRRDVKLDTTAAGAGIATTLENYPVPIRLDKASFDFSQAKPDGADIRFTKPDGSLLPHEIEFWDQAGQIAAIWVKTTVKGNDAAQSLVMHWGNPAAPNTSNGKAVFPTAENWVAVWHLGDDAAVVQDGFKDATGVNHATGHNLEPGSAVPGRMGRGTNIDHLKKQGVKVVENRKNFDLAKNITFQIWGFVRSYGYNKGYESYMTKGDESWRIMRAGTARSIESCSDSRAPVCVFGKSAIEFGKWYHFTGVHDGRAVRLYLNGKLEGKGNAGADHSSNGDHPATLGFSLHKNLEQRFMDMVMDEARFTQDSKSDDWIKLDYESLREGSTFVSFGPVR